MTKKEAIEEIKRNAPDVIAEYRALEGTLSEMFSLGKEEVRADTPEKQPAKKEMTKEEALRAIEEETPDFLEACRFLMEELSPLYGYEDKGEDPDDLEEIDAEELEELCEGIREFAEIYDADSILRMLDQAAGYRLPEGYAEHFKNIASAAKGGDWDSVQSILNEI